MLSIPKAILSTKEAIAYCGGRGAWDQLLNAFPDIMQPYRITGTKKEKQWHRETLDLAMNTAQLEGTFRTPTP